MKVIADQKIATHTQFNSLSWTCGEAYRMRNRGTKRVRIIA